VQFHTPPTEGIWNFLGGGGSGRAKTLKKYMKPSKNFQTGGEVFEKFSSVGEVRIFFGTTQNYFM